MQPLNIVGLVFAVAIGAAVTWLLVMSRASGLLKVSEERLAARDKQITGLQEAASDRDRRIALREQELSGERASGALARESVASLKAELAATKASTEEKIAALRAVETSLKESFEALAAKALDANSTRLIALTKGELGKQQVESASDLAAKEKAIESMLRPMKESLATLTSQSHDLEVKREGAYKAVLEVIENIQKSHVDLRKETTQLVQALRAPKVRGNWGEMILRDCVKFAGMVQYASFEVEKFVRGEDASYRPDLVVKLPNGRTIIVDAKTPLDAFLDAGAAEDETVRAAKLMAHAARVREHLKDLSSKAYWRQFIDSPDFVVCFLPSEVLFSAALEQDPSLIEFSAGSGVLLATPTTLITLLKAVAFGWQQAEIAKNAAMIRDTALSLYGKLAGLHTDFVDLGKRLKSAGGAYDDILTKVEGRGGIFSVSRKLRELGIGDKEIGDLKPIGLTLKTMEAEDWQPSLALAASADDERASLATTSDTTL